MFAVITSPQFWKEIEQVINSMEEDVLFQKIDEDIDLSEELEKVSRISVKYLIIDISCVADQGKITQSIMNYKMKRESTRIIIIAPNCLPGNPIMSFLFSLGIWDFLNPKGDKGDLTIIESLNECLQRQPSYQKGVKWFIGSQENDSQVSNIKEKIKLEKEVSERTVVIEKGKLLGTVVIAVVGAMNRIGTTHTVISLTKFLKDLNYNVAVMELKKSQAFTAIKNSYEDVKIDGNMFTLEGIDFYPYSENLSVLDILQDEYDYLILDMGVYDDCNIDEFRRANVRVIVSGVKDWELTKLELILNSDERIFKNKYYFTFSDVSLFKMVKDNMDKLQCYQAPYNPQPFEVSKECNTVFNELLKEFIPEVKKTQIDKRPRLLSILKRA